MSLSMERIMPVRLTLLLIFLSVCCLTLFITRTAAENAGDAAVAISDDFLADNRLVKRQASNATDDAPLDNQPSEPLSTKKPKKKKKNKKNKNKKPKTTLAPSATDVFGINSETDETTTMLADYYDDTPNMTLTFTPRSVYVYEGKLSNMSITYANLKTPITIRLKNVDPSLYKIVSNTTFKLKPLPDGENATVYIHVQGKKLGITGLAILVIEPNKPPPSEPASVHYIKVLRNPRIIDKIFDYSLLPLVIIATTGMGCKMEWTLIKSQLKRPFPISVGPLCQFVLMPFFSFAIAKMVKLDPLVAFGLLTVGSCPGGGLSNMITLLVQADLIQSVVMTFVSTVLAVGMLPLNLWIYARAFVPDNAGDDGEERMGLPLQKIIMQIIMLTIPLILGITIRHKLPKVAYYLLKPLNGLSAFLVVTSLGVGIYSNAYVILSPWEVLLSAFLLPVFGFTTGFLIGKFVARLPNRSAMTVCIETGVQNNLIAISMLKLSFPQPEADLMARTPIFVAITAVSIGIGMIVVAIPINRKMARKEAEKNKELNSVDEKADGPLPESPAPGYDYQPIPYEKAVEMNGNSKGSKEYQAFHDEPEEVKSEKEKMAEENGEDPLHVKMRKNSKETNV